MANYIDVEQAKAMNGLRIVASPGSIAPWSEAIKQIFTLKRVPYVLVAQKLPGPDLALKEWTAQTSAPVAVWNDERPRSTWLEQLYLAERLAPDPPLIPAAIDDRVLMFGLINEICGETGLAWSGRLRYLHQQLRATEPKAHHRAGGADEVRAYAQQLGEKYGYDPKAAEGATDKMVEVLRGLSAQLERQRAQGQPVLHRRWPHRVGHLLGGLLQHLQSAAGGMVPQHAGQPARRHGEARPRDRRGDVAAADRTSRLHLPDLA